MKSLKEQKESILNQISEVENENTEISVQLENLHHKEYKDGEDLETQQYLETCYNGNMVKLENLDLRLNHLNLEISKGVK